MISLREKIIGFFLPHAIISYAQCGEDILLRDHIFNGKKDGFYVDVGAHHPRRFSNTKLLYDQGWTGINIDPIPGMGDLFGERTRDINLNIGISSESGISKYYVHQKGAMSSFENISAESIEVEVRPLRIILDKYASKKKIDFLNIDVEGHEMKILLSNDWNKFPPDVIAIEDQVLDLSLPNTKTFLFLKEKGYKLIDKTNYTCFYRK